MKLIALFAFLLLTACSNKNQALDDITKFQEKMTLCGRLAICEDGMSQESMQGNMKAILSEFDRLELLALKEGFTEEQILAARKIGSRNAKSIAESKKAE